MLLSLAWRNIWRQRIRTILTLVSMAFSAALMVFVLSMQLGSYDMMRTSSLRVTEGFAHVEHPGYAEDADIADYFTDLTAVLAAVRAVRGITAAAPRGVAFAILANGEASFGAGLIGVDPVAEPQVTTLHTMVTSGRYLQQGDDDAIVLGSVLARNLGVGLGDRVTVLGSGADRSMAADSLRVVGLFETAVPQLNRQIAQMPLARFQDSFSMHDGANLIALSGAHLSDVNAALPALRAAVAPFGLVVRDWADLAPAIEQMIALDMVTSVATYVTLLFVVVFIILNTLLMSVLERTREFGMLMAVGMRPGLLGRVLWLEILILSALGCGGGVLIGAAVTGYFQHVGLYFPELEDVMAEFGLAGRIYPQLTIVSALAGPLAIALCVALGGIVPYARIRRLEPVSAMRAA